MLEVTNILDIHQPVQLIDNLCIFVQISRRFAKLLKRLEFLTYIKPFSLNGNEQ